MRPTAKIIILLRKAMFNWRYWCLGHVVCEPDEQPPCQIFGVSWCEKSWLYFLLKEGPYELEIYEPD